jgi:putative transposase
MSILATLFAVFRSACRSRVALELENLALRHQLNILQRSIKRPKLTPADRYLWVVLTRIWKNWRSALDIVQPQTVIAWHRQGFRLFWTWKVSRGKRGRLAVAREIRDLIRRMSRENPLWGVPTSMGSC